MKKKTAKITNVVIILHRIWRDALHRARLVRYDVIDSWPTTAGRQCSDKQKQKLSGVATGEANVSQGDFLPLHREHTPGLYEHM